MPRKHKIHLTRSDAEYVISTKEVEKDPAVLSVAFASDLLEGYCGQYDLLNFASLVSECEIRIWRKNGLIIEGRLNAAYTQKCVVSLTPISQEMNVEFSQKYAPNTSEISGNEIEIDPLSEDQPEPLLGGKLDIAALLLEIFALELDLYPRRSDAEIEPQYISRDNGDRESRSESPFAVLKNLETRD